MPNRSKIRILLLFYIALFAVGAMLVWWSTPRRFPFGIYGFGKILGVWGFTALGLQFILSSRSKLLEKGIGLDRIMRFHSLNAKMMFTAVLLHPFLLGAALNFKAYTLFHWLGLAAFGLMVVVLVTTLYSTFLKLNYEYWKVIHKIGYIILVLAFAHSFFLGTDILTRGPVFWWWIFLTALLGAGILTRQFHQRYKYEVTEVRRENDDVRTIKLKPLGQKMDHHPGQFAFVRFLGDISSEEHHFTLSSSPTDPYLSFTVKELGDFTAELGRLKKGDQAILDGPFGAFSNYLEAGPFLFISGGIGITPIISMVKYMFQNKVNKDSVLVYTVKEKKDLVFADEFDKIDREKWFEVIYRFTEKEGHLDENFFQKIKNLKKRTVYLVGPGAMVESTKALLLGLGVNPGQIHTELFALR